MANRRMFSKTITSSSRFLMMPATSRLLYYDLGMNADDDGFCEHFTVMRMTDAKPDDLKVLQARGFVRVFDDRVLIIADWQENNYLRSDRYSPSKYLEIYKQEMATLSGKNERYTDGIPSGDQMDTQVRLGKVRKGENTLRHFSEEFNKFWEKYPKKIGKGLAERSWKKIKPSQELAKTIIASVDAHRKTEQWQTEAGRFIPNPATYLDQRRWEDEIKVVDNSPLIYG